MNGNESGRGADLQCRYGHPLPSAPPSAQDLRILQDRGWDQVLHQIRSAIGDSQDVDVVTDRIADALRDRSHRVLSCSVCDALLMPDEEPPIDFDPDF